jgi:ABC-2 type transport system permease protein
VTTVAAAPGPRGSILPLATALVAKRALLVYLRTPQLIVLATLQMAVFMVGFRVVFGGAIGVPQGLTYVEFGVPGFIAAGVLYTTLGTAAAVAGDLQSGLIDRLRSLPMPKFAVLAGRVLADMAILTLSLAVTTAIGFAIGFRLRGSVAAGLGAFALCLAFGFAFSWVFIALGLVVRNAQAAQSLVMVVFIATFVSDAYVPAGSMPGWLRGFAENQPVTQMVNAVRGLALGDVAPSVLGHSTSYFVVSSLLWTAGIVVVSAIAAVLLYRRP